MAGGQAELAADIAAAAAEAEYAALVRGKTCLDCGKCARSELHPDEGYCTEIGEFVGEDDVPERDGMECFEEAA